MTTRGDSKEPVLKLLLIGDMSVGKSCLLLRFAEGRFEPDMMATMGIDFRLKDIDFGDKRVPFQLWDTAGQDRYRAITTAYYRGAQGVAIVYDTTSKKSFRNIRTWMRSLEQHAPREISKVLVGNKCDLDSEREVSEDMGRDLADEYGTAFFETSAMTGHGVDACFMHLARQVKQRMDNAGSTGGDKAGVVVVEPDTPSTPAPPCSCAI